MSNATGWTCTKCAFVNTGNTFHCYRCSSKSPIRIQSEYIPYGGSRQKSTTTISSNNPNQLKYTKQKQPKYQHTKSSQTQKAHQISDKPKNHRKSKTTQIHQNVQRHARQSVNQTQFAKKKSRKPKLQLPNMPSQADSSQQIYNKYSSNINRNNKNAEWNCIHCKFLNPASLKKCSRCLKVKPQCARQSFNTHQITNRKPKNKSTGKRYPRDNTVIYITEKERNDNEIQQHLKKKPTHGRTISMITMSSPTCKPKLEKETYSSPTCRPKLEKEIYYSTYQTQIMQWSDSLTSNKSTYDDIVKTCDKLKIYISANPDPQFMNDNHILSKIVNLINNTVLTEYETKEWCKIVSVLLDTLRCLIDYNLRSVQKINKDIFRCINSLMIRYDFCDVILKGDSISSSILIS
eukprot:334224_1